MIFPQKSAWPRGKMLGGSSQMNAMWYVRGSRHDYDRYMHLKVKDSSVSQSIKVLK